MPGQVVGGMWAESGSSCRIKKRLFHYWRWWLAPGDAAAVHRAPPYMASIAAQRQRYRREHHPYCPPSSPLLMSALPLVAFAAVD